MRTVPLISVVALTISGLAISYVAVPHLMNSPGPENLRASDAASPDLGFLGVARGDASEAMRIQAANVALQEKIEDLERRLRSLETPSSARAEFDHRPDQPQQTDRDQDKNGKRKRVTERDVGRWMDDSLSTGQFDPNHTGAARSKAEASLLQLEDVNLTEMRCSERFCRATLTTSEGQAPNVSRVIGAFPFAGGGFTIQEPNGPLKLYFTEPGQALDALQREAQEYSAANPDPA